MCKMLGQKNDLGKPDYFLIPPDALEGIAKVFTYGASKYAPDNWLKVSPPSRYFSAAMRHIIASRKEVLDPESGLRHLDHGIVSLIMYRELTKTDG
jgi:hypothetical protein